MSNNSSVGTVQLGSATTAPRGSVLGNATTIQPTIHKGGNPWHDPKSGRFTSGPAGENGKDLNSKAETDVLPIEKIYTLVQQNNLYSENLPNNISISLIYKESTLDPKSASKTSTSIGLAQINKKLITDVNNQFGVNYKYENLFEPEISVKVASLALELKDNYAHGKGYNSKNDPPGSNNSWFSALYAFRGSRVDSINREYATAIIKAANYLSTNLKNPLKNLENILHGH